MNELLTCDVIIAGAGPAGTACALALNGAGLDVVLIDKNTFPRDKICGDAISVDVLNQLPELSESLASEFESLSTKLEIPGIRIVSPGGKGVDLPFVYKGEPKPGYVCKRWDFDNLMVEHARKIQGIRFIESCQVKAATITKEIAEVVTSNGVIRGKIIVAADGAQSIFAKSLGNKINKAHYSAGLRVYYEGVEQMREDHYIELIFFQSLLPGYLWIFPLPGNRANVGLGVLSSEVSRKNLNLRKMLKDLILTHPDLKDRFRNARPLETVKGFGLPLGSVRRSISGDRLLLTGDAAGLIDPFSGEGIGNAIRSGRKAADHIRRAVEDDNFSAEYNKQYQKEVYSAMGTEFRISRSLQKVCKYPWLFNWIAGKASNPYWHRYLMDSLTDLNKKSRLSDPVLYLKMLFK